ncbi:MAG: lactonase family protein [Pyrinomonadaceae bacterium]
MANDPDDKEMRLYVGTYTSGSSKSKGIYQLRFDPKTGILSEPLLAVATEEPSFLAVSRDGKYLYSANETLKFEGNNSGYVSAFAIERSSGSLTFLNRYATSGAAPCHVAISEKGDLVVVANYLGGNVAVFKTNADGSLQPASDIKQHTGKGPNAERQEAPHCHSAIFDHTNKFVLVNDLGIDRIVTYAVDSKAGKLTANGESYAAKPGSGPRHFKFHPNGKFAFSCNELDMTVSSLEWDAKLGRLSEIMTVSTLPADYKRTNDSVADLHVSHDGKFLYVSNRVHDSIAVYVIDEKTGSIRSIDFTKTGGKGPRNFAIDPTGNFLLAANQRSDSITVLRIDKKTGKLTPTENTITVPTPVCLIFGK